MRENLIIYTQRPGASTPKDLKNALQCRRLAGTALRAVREVPEGSLVVNWGGSRYPNWAAGRGVRYLNNPEAVRNKTTKVSQIKRFVKAGIPTLEVTGDLATAQGWLRGGQRVLARQDGGFGGRGINVIEAGGVLDGEGATDFYSKYFHKTHEYRYFVFKGRVIDVAQKKKSTVPGVGDGNRSLHQRVVRSWENGWIFAHNDLHLPEAANEGMAEAALGAVRALGLDFGAVDVLANFGAGGGNRLLGLAVCEVNTAPGIENTKTLAAFVTAINEAYEG